VNLFHDDSPTCRATVSAGAVTLNPWRSGMGPHGPLKAGYAHVTASLADLRRLEDDELVVVPVRGTPWTDQAAATLLDWAARVGYRRVWLPDRVIELDALADVGWATATCPTCGARWEDGGPDFWERVRDHGWFPASCLACGGSLPEWGVPEECQADGPGADSPQDTKSRRTPCT